MTTGSQSSEPHTGDTLVVSLKGSKRARSLELSATEMRVHTALTREPLVVPRSAIAGFADAREPAGELSDRVLVRAEVLLDLRPGAAVVPNLVVAFAMPVVQPWRRGLHLRRRSELADGVLLAAKDPEHAYDCLAAAGLRRFPSTLAAFDTTIGSIPAALLSQSTFARRAKVPTLRRLGLILSAMLIAAVGMVRVWLDGGRGTALRWMIVVVGGIGGVGLLLAVRALRRIDRAVAVEVRRAAGLAPHEPTAPGG